MARSAAQAATEAADRLLDWLGRQPVPSPAGTAAGGAGGEAGEAAEAAGPLLPPELPGEDGGSAPNDARPGALTRNAGRATAPEVLRLAHTDWLHHRLVVTGAEAEVAAFRVAAAGAGTIPWRLDLDEVEQDLLHRLLAPAPHPRVRDAASARALARQLRDAVALRHAAALARVGPSRACPLDLHALVPVPDAVLRLGPDHPHAVQWLWRHWGTTEALRHVAEDRPPAGGRRPGPRTGPERLHLSFWSADWSPWRALARMGADWPALRFELRPSYEKP